MHFKCGVRVPLLGNCIIFLETGFFKRYKSKDEAYNFLFQHAKTGGIILCTSSLCLEEWRTQKIKHLEDCLRTFRQNISSHRGENYFSQLLLTPTIFEELDDLVYITSQSKNIINDFIDEHRIKIYPPLEKHIDSTWDAYFHGRPPFKERKNKNDIPDAWIYEGAKDAIETPEHAKYELRYCLSDDKTMSSALESLGYRPIKLQELIELLHKENIQVKTPEFKSETQVVEKSIHINEEIKQTPLDELLAKTIHTNDREIYLRLLGYLAALDTPTHEQLISCVVLKGYNPKRVEACAVMLSGEPNPYIKDLGAHYIVGNQDVCHAAAERVMNDIIEMLDQE